MVSGARGASLAKAFAEQAARGSASRELAAYVPYTLGFVPAPHHELICRKLDEVIEAKIRGLPGKRIIVAAPPGHAKSTYTSLGFAGQAMGRMPDGSSIVAAAHTDEFAQSWGRKVRNLCQSEAHARVFPRAVVSADDRAAARWRTTSNNEYFSVGVGGSVTGRRADILLCDDLLRGREDADNKKRRELIRNWFFADAMTRLKPGGSIIIIATRWHEDDLTGTLIDAMKTGGEQWDFVNLPALCEDPETDLLGRKKGDALWPTYISKEELVRIRDSSGMPSREWASLYQQRPSPEAGNLVLREWFPKFRMRDFRRQMGNSVQIVVSIDTAQKKGDRNDPTVAEVFAYANGNSYLVQEFREKHEYVEMKKAIYDFLDGVRQEWGSISAVLIEDKGNGTSLISSMKNERKEAVIAMEPKKLGDKEFRFDKCTPSLEAGKLWVPDDSEHKFWVDPYMDELVTFPAARNDDRVDATSQYLNWRDTHVSRKRRMRVVRGLG